MCWSEIQDVHPGNTLYQGQVEILSPQKKIYMQLYNVENQPLFVIFNLLSTWELLTNDKLMVQP